jgi:two-component system, OmpR family, sensor histidine kinase KdpD
MTSDPARPTPEQLLEQAEREERKHRRGKLKVFLGYASGVGKSEQMFDEGRRRRERGQDVVVGATQLQSPVEVERILAGFELVPPLKVEGQDVIDVLGIIRRRPKVVIIDGLAYDNPPGSRNRRRCDDVEELLAAGISVVASVNLHYIEEFQHEVASITGKKETQSVPRKFLERAEEIVVVDAPAHDEKLSRLRQMALLLAADVIESQLENYLHSHGLEETWGTQERVLVCITPRSNATPMIDSGKRIADRFKGELYVLYVRQAGLSPEDQAALDRNIAIAIERGANVNVIESGDAIDGIVDFAREHGITQIVIGHSVQQGWLQGFKKTKVERLIELAEGIDVRIVPQ